MKTTLRLLSALVVPLVLTASAPAWCHRMAAAPSYPMSYPMIPSLPAAGMSFNMSMTGSGDLAFMGPLMLRQLISGFLGSPGANQVETQLITALPKLLPLLGVPTMTADQIGTILKDVHDARESVKGAQETMKGMQDTMKDMQTTMKGLQTAVETLTKTMQNPPSKTPTPPSPETARARAEVKRLLVEIKARPGNPNRPAAAVVASQRSTAELRAEVKQLLAEIKAAPSAPLAPRGATIARRGN